MASDSDRSFSASEGSHFSGRPAPPYHLFDILGEFDTGLPATDTVIGPQALTKRSRPAPFPLRRSDSHHVRRVEFGGWWMPPSAILVIRLIPKLLGDPLRR
jgi:hypothetical protein